MNYKALVGGVEERFELIICQFANFYYKRYTVYVYSMEFRTSTQSPFRYYLPREFRNS